MADIFERRDIHSCMGGKSLLFLGDSIMRNIYKDFVFLTSPKVAGGLIPRGDLCEKGEKSYCGDKLIDATAKSAGRDYREVRDWYEESCDIQYTFAFITQCYNRHLKEFIIQYPKKFGSYPDVIIINSALWDINRWGPHGIRDFKDNISDLMSLLRKVLPNYTQVIWMTTPPISVEIRGGFMIEQLQFQQYSMRFNVMEGNAYAARLVSQFGFDVLDMHHYFYHDLHRRAPDGIHWNPDAVRMQVNIILTHVCLSRDIPLPGKWKGEMNFQNTALDKAIAIAKAAEAGLGLPKQDVSETPPKPEEQKKDTSGIAIAKQPHPVQGTDQQVFKKPQPLHMLMKQSPLTMKQSQTNMEQKPNDLGSTEPPQMTHQPLKKVKKAKRRMNQQGRNGDPRNYQGPIAPWGQNLMGDVFVNGMPVQPPDNWNHAIGFQVGNHDYFGNPYTFNF